MKKECVIKLSILTFSLFLFISSTMPQTYNAEIEKNATSVVNINDNIDINNEKSNESYIMTRKSNPNPRSNQKVQHFTTWVGIVLIGILFLVGIRCFETEKRL